MLKHTARSVAQTAFGLSQCTTSRCLMNGCGCDEEMSAQPFVPCVVCSRKLLAVGAIVSGRHLHERLLAFFEQHNGANCTVKVKHSGTGRFGSEIAWLRLRLAR
jgi:hypothetical protein